MTIPNGFPAAPALGNGDAQQAGVAQLGPQVAREFVAAVDVGGARRDALAREAPDLRAHLVELLAEPEVEIAAIECVHLRG